jgi:hypothetical protein
MLFFYGGSSLAAHQTASADLVNKRSRLTRLPFHCQSFLQSITDPSVSIGRRFKQNFMINKLHTFDAAFDRLLIAENVDQPLSIVAFRRYGIHGFHE